MATPSDSRAVKSLNNSEGKKRFVFKNFDSRMNEIMENNLFRSLDKVKPEPKEGSTFFKDCLFELRELNTTAEFILFYEEMLPFVQTRRLVRLQKELIFSKLVSGLQKKARFSLEAFLRLIAALSTDLSSGFIPFLPRVVNSLVTLLKNGGQKEPEIIEQIILSWSDIMRDMQKYLICDIEGILRYLKLKVCRRTVNDGATAEDIITENIVFLVSGLHSMIGQSDHEYWSSLESDERAEFLKAFIVFDSGKVRSTFLALTSGNRISEKVQDDVRNVLIGSLLKRMGKIALDMVDTIETKIVLSAYKEFASQLNQEECRLYAFKILLPLYKFCQGYGGKVISDELKQQAEEVRDSVRDKSLGSQVFVQVYREIKQSLETKREKRKREEKLMAVINPERNAKRKLKLASKNKANKKRRIMSNKMHR